MTNSPTKPTDTAANTCPWSARTQPSLPQRADPQQLPQYNHKNRSRREPVHTKYSLATRRGGSPSPYATGEISVQAAAEQLSVSTNVIYYWIETGQLTTHRGTGNRHRIPWTPTIEDDCRQRITDSTHLIPQPQTPPAGEAV